MLLTFALLYNIQNTQRSMSSKNNLLSGSSWENSFVVRGDDVVVLNDACLTCLWKNILRNVSIIFHLPLFYWSYQLIKGFPSFKSASESSGQVTTGGHRSKTQRPSVVISSKTKEITLSNPCTNTLKESRSALLRSSMQTLQSLLCSPFKLCFESRFHCTPFEFLCFVL